MTTLYWFSGTGNSLALAREIARTLGDARLVPIASLGPGPVTVDGDFGLVCPVYFYGLPLLVRDFLARVDARSAPYAFCVLDAGGFPGWAATQARCLGRRAGKSFDAVYNVVMPGNYIAMYDVRGGDARERVLGAARDDARGSRPMSAIAWGDSRMLGQRSPRCCTPRSVIGSGTRVEAWTRSSS
jgi:hypothetical protein